MKNLTHFAVAGVIAAAIMVLAKLLLSQQAVLAGYHYPAFDLAGREGLHSLAIYALYGAGYAVAYGLILKAILPGGLLLGSLALATVPTLVSALVLPMYHNLPANKDPWSLAWGFAHWTIYSLCLVFIAGGKGGGKKSSED